MCPRCELARWSTRRRRLRTAAVAALAVAAVVGACASIAARRSAEDTDALLATIAAVRGADERSPVLPGIVAANTRCPSHRLARAAVADASLYELWSAELRCPPSVEASIDDASQWDMDFWQSHHGPRSAVALRAGLVALARDRQQCVTWSTSARALDLYGNAVSADGACIRYSDTMAEFLRDKVLVVRAIAGRPARIALACALALALAAFVAALGAWRSARRMRRTLVDTERGPYRSALSCGSTH